MTRILGVADLHIGATHLTTSEEQKVALLELVHIVDNEHIDVVVIAGDATHHARPTPETLAMLGWFYKELEGRDVDVIQIAGNHDPRVPSITDYFRGRVHVALEPRIVQLDTGRIGLGLLDVACLPWLPDSYIRAKGAGQLTREETAQALTNAAREIVAGFRAARRPGVPMILVAHGTVAGTETSSGWSMGWQGGTEWRISVEDAAQFDLAVVGHIHRHQSPATNVVVPGSLLPLDFSEVDRHGVIVADLAGSRGVPDPLLDAAWRFVEIPGPTVFTLEWDDRELVRSMTMLAVFDTEFGRRQVPDKLRVRLTCTEENARRFPTSAIVAQLTRAGAKYVQVELEVVRPDRVKDDTTAELSPAHALGRYIGTRDDLDSDQRERVLFHGISTIEKLRATTGAEAGGDLSLTAIEVKDFLGVHDARVEFDGHGVYAITGAVGSGKSSLGADAPRFALFGASRYGAKVTDNLVRQGADVASAAVELVGADGRQYRVIRKVKKTPRGAVSTLDVLADGGTTGHDWIPMSDGKVAGGQAVVDRILGGLDDATLTASSIVVQRDAGLFMRARPEERKTLLAEAAGLSVFDELTESTRELLRGAERELDLLHARAMPLRARAATVPDTEKSLALAADKEREYVEEAAHRETEVARLRSEFEQAADRANTYERGREEFRGIRLELEAVDAEIAEWNRKRTAADAIVAAKAQLLRSREALMAQRAVIVTLEAEVVAMGEQNTRRSTALEARGTFERHFTSLRHRREADARDLDRQIDAAKKRTGMIATAECCAPEPSCVFLDDARAARDSIATLEEQLAQMSEPTPEETRLLELIAKAEVPPAVDLAPKQRELTDARRKAADLERATEVADKIARAEQVITEHEEALPKLQARREDFEARKLAKDVELVDFGPSPSGEAQRARTAWNDAQLDERNARAKERLAGEMVAELRGRLATLREAAVELEGVEREITVAAADVAALKVLVDAWRACRVNVLESSVIPAVEDTANEVLRKFPYGLQIAFATQRERRSGGGVSEALDVEVLGGRAPLYEGCSGGQKTVIDVALHLAVALVVSRRASSRLRWVFLDEPEGLDEPGRAAMGALCTWINETYGLTVLLASHSADLIDALGGQRIDVVAGDNGSTVVAA